MRMEKQKKLKHAPSATPYKQSRAVPTKSTTKPFVSVVARYHITPLTSFDTLRKHAYIILTPPHPKPPFYIVKWGLQGYTLFVLFLLKNIDCGYSLEPPHRGGSNEFPRSMF